MLNLHSTASEQRRLDEVRRRPYGNRDPAKMAVPCQGLQCCVTVPVLTRASMVFGNTVNGKVLW